MIEWIIFFRATCGVEEDLHSVAPACYDWRQEVIGIRWIQGGAATAIVHQGCSVPICDFDIVAWAGGAIATSWNIKAGELKPQKLSIFHLYHIRSVQQAGIAVRAVWWSQHACGEESLILSTQTFCFLSSLRNSPSGPQPPIGQSVSCQSPAPVVESETQVRNSMAQIPQQHLSLL